MAPGDQGDQLRANRAAICDLHAGRRTILLPFSFSYVLASDRELVATFCETSLPSLVNEPQANTRHKSHSEPVGRTESFKLGE